MCELKKCSKCGEEKCIDKFSRGRILKDTNERSYLSICRTCANRRTEDYRKRVKTASRQESNKERYKKYKEVNKGRERDLRLQRQYGISQEDYDKMLNEQNGKCLICGAEGNLFVDHCHESGRVRALLCNSCNSAIGHLREDEDILIKATWYVKEYCGK